MKKIFLNLFFFFLIFSSSAQGPAFQWAKNFGGTGAYSEGWGIVTDGSGNVYTCGTFSGTVDFDPGAGVYTLTTVSIQENGFISKLDPSGNFLWAKQFGSSGYANLRSVAIDASGNVYAAGFFQGTVDFDPGAGTYTLSSIGVFDVSIIKLNASGAFVWAKNIGGATSNSYGFSIKIDGAGNVYTTGEFNKTVDFDPGPGTYNLASTTSGIDIFMSKLDASGTFVWAKRLEPDPSSSVSAPTIGVDASNNPYIAAYFNGDIDLDPGVGVYTITAAHTGSEILIIKLNSSGNFIWGETIGGGDIYYSSMVIDGASNVCILGNFSKTGGTGAPDFDPGLGVYTMTSTSYGNPFVCKLNTSGSFLWAKQFKTLDSYAQAITVDILGDIYIAGDLSDSLDCDPGPGAFMLYSYTGKPSVYVSKINSSGNFVWAKSMLASITTTNYATSGRCLSVDPSGNVYTTGFFENTVNFDPAISNYSIAASGIQDVFIHKMAQGPLVIENNTSDEINLSAYPNPFSNSFTLNLNETSRIKITNAIGQLIFEEMKTKGKHIIDLPNESAGIYFLQVNDQKNNFTLKLIRE